MFVPQLKRNILRGRLRSRHLAFVLVKSHDVEDAASSAWATHTSLTNQKEARPHPWAPNSLTWQQQRCKFVARCRDRSVTPRIISLAERLREIALPCITNSLLDPYQRCRRIILQNIINYATDEILVTFVFLGFMPVCFMVEKLTEYCELQIWYTRPVSITRRHKSLNR